MVAMEKKSIISEDSSEEFYFVYVNKPNTETERMLIPYKCIKEVNNKICKPEINVGTSIRGAN